MKIVNIDGYKFEGPYQLDVTVFNDVPGIYVISDQDGKYIDIGQTDTLKTRLSSHERKVCWVSKANQTINVWFHKDYNESSRLSKEKEIRDNHSFHCGLI